MGFTRYGAHPNALDKHANTALHYAVAEETNRMKVWRIALFTSVFFSGSNVPGKMPRVCVESPTVLSFAWSHTGILCVSRAI